MSENKSFLSWRHTYLPKYRVHGLRYRGVLRTIHMQISLRIIVVDGGAIGGHRGPSVDAMGGIGEASGGIGGIG